MKNYNGYRSWNAWNVSLWINNDSFMYTFCLDLLSKNNLRMATNIFCGMFYKTPDGALYNNLSVFNTLKELKESHDL
jgi:hypothetical protein